MFKKLKQKIEEGVGTTPTKSPSTGNAQAKVTL